MQIDKKLASFIITGSSARKLRKKGTNLLPGRVKNYRLDPLQWNELNWSKGHSIRDLEINNLPEKSNYIFEKSLIFGTLLGIATLDDDDDRRDFLRSYSQIYLEEEIRAEALSRKMGAFHRFLELAAQVHTQWSPFCPQT